MPQITRESVYGQYILDLKSAIELLDGVGFKVKQQEKITRRQRIKNIIYGLMMPFGFSYRLININTKKIK